MQFTSSTRVNAIVWITSLRDEETGVSRRVTEDLRDFSQRAEMPFEMCEPRSAAELLAILDELAIFSKSSGWRPIIHLDTHGSVDHGVQISSTGEFVGWPALVDRFRAINVATGNNLIVVSHACFSFHVVKQMDVRKPTPFFMLFAPVNEIHAGTIEANTCGFYRDILSGHDVIEAVERWFQNELKMFHCQRMLAELLSRIVDASYIGKRAQLRKEDLLTKAIAAGQPSTRHNRRRLRKIADGLVKPTPQLVVRTASVFLMGQDPGFRIDDVMEIVMAARKNGRFLGPSPYDDHPPADPDGSDFITER